MQIYHRDLDEVGSRALNRRIYGHSFGVRAGERIAAVDVAQAAAATQKRLDVAVRSGSRAQFMASKPGSAIWIQ